MVGGTARLLALDWGSTSLRAFLLGARGQVLETRAAQQGSAALQGGALAYEAALERIAGDWLALDPALPVLACGMVGSRQGWIEAPYVACPAGAPELIGGLARVRAAGREIAIVPGMSCRGAASKGSAPDLMRGEETQIVGALALRPALESGCTLVLPGTHSKWTRVERGQVLDFATYMTGELYAVLRAHSLLGALMADGDQPDPDAFAAGVRASADGTGLAHQLFAVRTLGLSGELAAGALPAYLSGLLIGHEIQAALAVRGDAGGVDLPLVLVGEPGLTALYERAFVMCGAPSVQTLANTAPQGLWRLAAAAGLVTVTEESRP